MEIFNLIFTILLFFSFKKSKNEDFISLKTCNVLKGICILAVFIGHTSKIFKGIFLYKFYCSIGLFAVSLFFFISGYGLMYGYLRKENYQEYFFKKRIFPVLICYTLACCVYWGISGGGTPLLNIFICSFVPYSWFIFSIISLYLMFLVSMRLTHRRKPSSMIAFMSFFLAGYVFLSYWITAPYPLMGGHQMVVFLIGMIMATYPAKLKAICQRRYVLVLFFFVSWGISLTSKYWELPLWSMWMNENVQSYLFPFVTFSFLMYFCLNKFHGLWLFLQKHSLQIYLAHGIVLHVMKTIDWMPSEILVFFIFVMTLIIAIVFRSVTNIIGTGRLSLNSK